MGRVAGPVQHIAMKLSMARIAIFFRLSVSSVRAAIMGRSPVVCGDSIQALCQPDPSGAVYENVACDGPWRGAPTENARVSSYRRTAVLPSINRGCSVLSTANTGAQVAITAGKGAITSPERINVTRRRPRPLASLLAAMLASMPALAQTAPVSPTATTPRTSPPSPETTMRAYNAVDEWVRAWRRPADRKTGANELVAHELPPVAGACVTLRWQGHLVGRGVADDFRSTDDRTAEDARRTVLARAAAAAISAAEPRLPLPNDLSRDEAVRQITPDVMISLELAGDLRPVTAETWDELDTALNPGLDGLAVSMVKPGATPGPAVHAPISVKFPSEMMLADILPQRALRGMIAASLSDAGAPIGEALADPKSLREKHGLRVWTFRVSHAAQTSPRSPPTFLFRGSRLIAVGEISLPELRAMRDRLAANVLARCEELSAERNPAQLGLALYAMHRWSIRRQSSDNPDAELHRRFEERKGPLAGPLLERIKAGRLPADSPDGAFARVGLMSSGRLRELRLQPPQTGPRPQPVNNDPGRSPSLWAGLITDRSLQTIEHNLHPGDNALAERYSPIVRDLFAATPTSSLVAEMPWLGWAELDIASSLSIGRSDAPPADIPSAVALRDMRAQCWKHQLGFSDVNDDSADMLGGIIFTKGTGTPLPTWQCVRPIAFLATMLGDGRLTEPAERAQETFRLMLALRFLRQLQVDESCGWMHPEPEQAIGAIRAAPWDLATPPDAASLTLLAVCEAISSLEMLQAETKADKK